MRGLRNSGLVGVAILMVMLSGCVLKKRRPPIPQQGQAPTIAAPIPESIPEEAETTPPPPPPPPATQNEAEKKTKHRHIAKKASQPPPAPPAQGQNQASQKPGRVLIQEGGSQPQGTLTASLGAEEATHQRLSTAQLLDATENNLKGLTRQLSSEEQAMVVQIKDFMEQSRKATQESDPVRAHNLALKAHLLSDELVRR